MLTQLCKMLLLATFFPTSDVPVGGFDVIGVSTTGTSRLGIHCINKFIYTVQMHFLSEPLKMVVNHHIPENVVIVEV